MLGERPRVAGPSGSSRGGAVRFRCPWASLSPYEPPVLQFTFTCRSGRPPNWAIDQAERCVFHNRVEVMGFEPTASTLRTCGSRRFEQVLCEDFPGSGVSIPSGSLTIPLGKVTQGHAAPSGSHRLMTTITCFDELEVEHAFVASVENQVE